MVKINKVNIESKSQLAKLLATENLTIEHQKLSTAKFDPKNRILYCPIWQDMSGALYDLLMGHEVGHALYTPAEGWHDAVSTLGKKYKGFLNVVEDARIEKKVKRKFPGIRTSFSKGYQNLLDRDFFGLKNRDVNTMSFIDRLNIYTKSAGLTKITFSPEEQKLVSQVEACETWEDVLRVTKAVFEYSKNEQFETMQQALASMVESQSGDDGDGEEYETSDSDYDGESEEDGEGEGYSDDEDTDTDGKGEEQGEKSESKSNNDG
jgi:cobalamin biosynthesis protein CobT